MPSGLTFVLTIGSQTIIATKKNRFIIGDRTQKPGAAITHAATLTSLRSRGSEAIIPGTTTSAFDAGQKNRSSPKNSAGDGTTDLPGLKPFVGFLIVNFFLGFFF